MRRIRGCWRAPGEAIPRLVDGGLPVVLSQTFRTLIHSRLEIGMKGYERSHPGTTIVLFEPDQRDPAMFLANTFSYSQRRTLAEHAYQQTRRMLRSRRGRLAAQLAPHGVRIDAAVLDQPRRLLSPVRAATRNTAQALAPARGSAGRPGRPAGHARRPERRHRPQPR